MAEGFGETVEKLRRITVAVKVPQGGGGSGVIWSADGAIVTNAHVVEGAGGAVEVELWNGSSLKGKLVKRDPRRDVATLQVDASDLSAATPGDSNALRAGELVIAVGNPMGFIGAASTGVVYGFDRRSWVVSQLRLAPGNSGGPLANARGEVVGINTMMTRGGISGGLAFAIPSNFVKQFLSSQPFAGVGLGVVVRPILAGLIILEVIPGSPADHASLLQGDVLVGAYGKRFQFAQDLQNAINASRGGILELQFRRGASANVRTVAVQMAAAARAA
ncbi:MAG: S1C family serine protease [Bryobacteraceae bacterium]